MKLKSRFRQYKCPKHNWKRPLVWGLSSALFWSQIELRPLTLWCRMLLFRGNGELLTFGRVAPKDFFAAPRLGLEITLAFVAMSFLHEVESKGESHIP